ncbi:hypothetical protein D6158_12365 [Nocardia seriolae]|nr:hypothetical protein D6158_12365 [Nocardia seriolae]
MPPPWSTASLPKDWRRRDETPCPARCHGRARCDCRATLRDRTILHGPTIRPSLRIRRGPGIRRPAAAALALGDVGNARGLGDHHGVPAGAATGVPVGGDRVHPDARRREPRHRRRGFLREGAWADLRRTGREPGPRRGGARRSHACRGSGPLRPPHFRVEPDRNRADRPRHHRPHRRGDRPDRRGFPDRLRRAGPHARNGPRQPGAARRTGGRHRTQPPRARIRLGCTDFRCSGWSRTGRLRAGRGCGGGAPALRTRYRTRGGQLKLNQFAAQLRRYWATFGVVAVIVAAAGIGLAVLSPPRYVSTTQLLVSIEGSTTASAYENDNVVTGRVATYVALLTTDAVAQRVIDRLGLTESPRDLAGQISAAAVPPRTAIIDVAVTDSSPDRARRIAAAIGPEFIAYADSLETPTGEDKQQVRTKVVTAAGEPGSRLPETLSLAGLGVVTGLLLGAVAVWIRGRTDPVLRTTADAAAAGVPLLGSVAAVPAPSEDEFIGYRGLRAHLERRPVHLDQQRAHLGQFTPTPSVWVIASATGEADVATVARNLSRTIERHGGQPVVLVGDSCDPAQARALIEPARPDHTHVLVTAPPVTKSVSASVYGEFSDGVVLLAALDSSRRGEVRAAVAHLRAAAVRVAGIVVANTWKHNRTEG